jgi:hypothetical protein
MSEKTFTVVIKRKLYIKTNIKKKNGQNIQITFYRAMKVSANSRGCELGVITDSDKQRIKASQPR